MYDKDNDSFHFDDRKLAKLKIYHTTTSDVIHGNSNKRWTD